MLGVALHAFETEGVRQIALLPRDSLQVVTESPLPPDGLEGEDDENGVQELPENSDGIDQVDADLPRGEHGQ